MIGLDLLGHGGGHGGHGHHGGHHGFIPQAVSYYADAVVVDAPEDETDAQREKRLLRLKNAANAGLIGLDILGAADPTVRAVQQALNAAGFDTKGVDGLMGKNTADAITAFWSARGQSHTPVIDADLLAALRVDTPGADASQAPQNAPQDDAAAERNKKLLIGGGVAAALIGVLLLLFGGKK